MLRTLIPIADVTVSTYVPTPATVPPVDTQPTIQLPTPRSTSTRPGRDQLRILESSRKVLRDGAALSLTRLEFDLLLHLARRPDRVHRRSALLNDVWGQAGPVRSRTVDVHVRRLRLKLGPYAW